MSIEQLNLDANESAFVARELEDVKSRTFDKKYPNLQAKKLIPVSTEVDAGAETSTYQSWDSVGLAKIIANYADDLPRVDVSAREFTVKVKTIGDAYGWNVIELKNAIKAGKSLNSRKSDSARMAIEQKLDNLAWFGDSTSGCLGMLNQPNVPASTVQTGAVSGNVRWIGATPKNPDEIIKDLSDIRSEVIDLTNGVEVPMDILIPIAQNEHISNTARSATSDTTIKQFFLNNNPNVSITAVPKLKGVTPLPSGAGGPKDVMMSYVKDPNNLEFEIPLMLEQMEPEKRNLEFVVDMISRVAGVRFYYPLSANIFEGI